MKARTLPSALAGLLLICSTAAAVAAGDGVFRFWWNAGNVADGKVNGIEDRENFFPLLLDIGPFVTTWGNGGVAFRLRGNGALNVAFTSMDRSDVWALYRSDAVRAGENFSRTMDSAPVVQITPEGIDIPKGVLARIRGGRDVVLACEVRPGANTGVLQFEAVADGTVLFHFALGCAASDVRSMYHWINLRHVSGQAETVPTMTVPPVNADWSDGLPHVFFVHGANVDEEASRVWSADDASAASDPTVFATNTVFNPFPPTITNAVLSEAEINAHLTQGIPALSRALGSVPLNNDDGLNSYDMNTQDDLARPNDWPNNSKDFGKDWLHSDIKDIPYFYTYPVFDLIIKKGDLK